MADSDIFFAKCECKCCTRALRFLVAVPRMADTMNCSLLHWSGSLTAGGFRRLSYRGKGLLDGSRPAHGKSRPSRCLISGSKPLSFERITQRAFGEVVKYSPR